MKLAKTFIVFTFLLAFAICVSAQSNQYPNELKGYEFFGNGKLKGLELIVSSKDDVKRIFGNKCGEKCDYDADWTIRFSYYEDIWIRESRNEKDEKLTYFLDSKYLGKLRSIEIRPKKQVSFVNAYFPNTFQKLLMTSNGALRSDKRRMLGDEAFQDSSGLTYEILSRISCNDSEDKKAESYNNGELVVIRYDIPKDLEKGLFILPK